MTSEGFAVLFLVTLAAALLVGWMGGRWWSWNEHEYLRDRIRLLEDVRDYHIERIRELEEELEAFEELLGEVDCG